MNATSSPCCRHTLSLTAVASLLILCCCAPARAQDAPPAPDASAASAEPLPAAVDLGPTFRDFGLDPRVQGGRGTCSVFVVTQAIELALARKEGHGRRLSVEFLNWAANDACGDRADGGFFSELWRGFERHGICTEEALPYQPSLRPDLVPSEQALTEAKRTLALGLRLHWIKEWDSSKGPTAEQLRSMRAALARGSPVCGGLLWPKSQTWESDTLKMCPREQVFDGHSVLLVGYRDDPALPGGGAFRIRNSAGPSREGWLTYEYVQAYLNDAAWIDATADGEARPR